VTNLNGAGFPDMVDSFAVAANAWQATWEVAAGSLTIAAHLNAYAICAAP
jgi:hypothetical protein